MTDRTLTSLLGGAVAGLVILVAAWIILSAYEKIGWQIPVAAGVAVFVALWVVDWLSSYLEKRRA